jgi:hypothetical protein
MLMSTLPTANIGAFNLNQLLLLVAKLATQLLAHPQVYVIARVPASDVVKDFVGHGLVMPAG